MAPENIKLSPQEQLETQQPASSNLLVQLTEMVPDDTRGKLAEVAAAYDSKIDELSGSTLPEVREYVESPGFQATLLIETRYRQTSPERRFAQVFHPLSPVAVSDHVHVAFGVPRSKHTPEVTLAHEILDHGRVHEEEIREEKASHAIDDVARADSAKLLAPYLGRVKERIKTLRASQDDDNADLETISRTAYADVRAEERQHLHQRLEQTVDSIRFALDQDAARRAVGRRGIIGRTAISRKRWNESRDALSGSMLSSNINDHLTRLEGYIVAAGGQRPNDIRVIARWFDIANSKIDNIIAEEHDRYSADLQSGQLLNDYASLVGSMLKKLGLLSAERVHNARLATGGSVSSASFDPAIVKEVDATITKLRAQEKTDKEIKRVLVRRYLPVTNDGRSEEHIKYVNSLAL